MAFPSVAVIGAGISGLTCAHRLAVAANVTVFEWGRGPGGRTARRRAPIGDTELSFDHAAPFFEVRTTAFRDGLLRQWEEQGVAARWGTEGDRWVGVPSNNAICKALSSSLETEHRHQLLYGRHVLSARYLEGSWVVEARNRAADRVEKHRFDALVLSDKLAVLPNEYAVLAPEEAEQGPLALPAQLASSMVAILLVAFAEPLGVADLEYPADSAVLRMLVRDSSKPGRVRSPDMWVAHSTAAFAERHISSETGAFRDEAAVSAEMQEAFLAHVGRSDQPIFSSVFAWDHAQPISQLTSPFKLDEERRAGLCGDLFFGDVAAGVEAAALSGSALADAMLPLFGPRAEL